jgi:heptosyltransferase-2
MNRILVVSVNWLGDAIMTTPAFKALKDRFPSSYLGVMAPERVKEVFEDNPYINEIIIFDQKTRQKSLSSKLKFISYLRKRKFDTVFLIQRSFTRAFICYLAGIKTRIGYKRLKTNILLSDSILMPSQKLHRQDFYLNLFEKQGIPVKERLPAFFIPRKIQDKVNVSLQSLRRNYSYLVGINPSANWDLKRWAPERFSQLADRLIDQHKAGVIFIGSKKEQKLIDQVIVKMKEKAYDFCGRTTLKELGALIKNLDLFISNDSGPAHLSASLNVPTLVLFGPTSKEITSPKGEKSNIIQKEVDCQLPCYNLNCRNNYCMQTIEVEEVAQKAKKILLMK